MLSMYWCSLVCTTWVTSASCSGVSSRRNLLRRCAKNGRCSPWRRQADCDTSNRSPHTVLCWLCGCLSQQPQMGPLVHLRVCHQRLRLKFLRRQRRLSKGTSKAKISQSSPTRKCSTKDRGTENDKFAQVLRNAGRLKQTCTTIVATAWQLTSNIEKGSAYESVMNDADADK